MQCSGLYSLISRLPLVYMRSKVATHVVQILYGGLLYIHPSFLGSSKRLSYHIVGNFRGRKLSRITEKYDFRGENFRRLLAFASPKEPHLKFCGENFCI